LLLNILNSCYSSYYIFLILIILLTIYSYYLTIGAIIESGDDELENAFRHAVDRVNSDRTVLPRTKLVARIERIKPHDSFHAAKLSKLSTYYIHSIY
jgi:ionotropic kainate glutamate receptor 2